MMSWQNNSEAFSFRFSFRCQKCKLRQNVCTKNRFC